MLELRVTGISNTRLSYLIIKNYHDFYCLKIDLVDLDQFFNTTPVLLDFPSILSTDFKNLTFVQGNRGIVNKGIL